MGMVETAGGKVHNKVEYDKCIQCGVETHEPKNKPVYLRNYYVDGAGQLCIECYSKVYDK